MIDYRKQIVSDPKIMLGKPRIKDTRITVELILRKLADGYTADELMEMYPHINKDDIFASIAYAAAILASEEIILAA